MQKIEVDSVYHLSSSKGIVFGAGITKGSEGTTAMGERIQAGKFPVLFYGNKYIESKKKDFRTERKNHRIMRRLGVLNSTLTLKTSCANQGNSNTL